MDRGTPEYLDALEALGRELRYSAEEGGAATETGGNRLQNLICLSVPIYNVFASLEGWPQIPLPAFCTTPAPTPTPAP